MPNRVCAKINLPKFFLNTTLVVNFPHMNSNIPANPAYGVYASQLVRIGRICKDFEAFNSRHRTLTDGLIKQGYTYRMLCVSFKKFSRRHSLFFCKFGVALKRHINHWVL